MMDIPLDVISIINLLESNNHEAYVVGGSVRDFLIGLTPSDWDISTSATPDEIMKIFENFTTIPTGIEHGTITIIINKEPVEVTTFRIDGDYKDGRRPTDVTFSSSLLEDLKRRDFTINAMAYHPKKGVLDYFGGQKDLENKIVRCVGDTKERFAEDYLRMVRAYRIAAVLDFNVTKEIFESVQKDKNNLEYIAKERLQQETIKVFENGKTKKVIEFINLFAFILFPSFYAATGTQKDKALQVFCYAKTLEEQLASLYIELSAKAAKKDLEYMKFSNAVINKVFFLVSHGNDVVPKDKIEVKTLLSQWGEDNFFNWVHFTYVLFSTERKDEEKIKEIEKMAHEIIKNKEPFALFHLEIDGNDLVKNLDSQPGVWVGECLKALLKIVIENPKANTYDNLMKKATQWHRSKK